MAQSYDELIQSVRDWSNRDSQVLPDSVIQQCLRFAADTAYRQLMIPPFENTIQYALVDQATNVADLNLPSYVLSGIVDDSRDNILSGGYNSVSLPIPGDLTSFIHLRLVGSYELNSDGTVSRDSRGNLVVSDTSGIGGYSRAGAVWNEKADNRTFHDLSAETYDINFWTRQEGNILARGQMNAGDVFELYYYRRLAALNARYNQDTTLTTAAAVRADGRYSEVTTSTPAPTGVTTFTVENIVFYGNLVPNWLREENDKVILFGALHHVYDYLQEADATARYGQKFIEAIGELNDEERTRKSSGGNVQMNFNGRGLI